MKYVIPPTELQNKEYGKLSFYVPEGTPILWHGDYQLGKLSIYKAHMIGTASTKLICLAYIYADARNEDESMFGWVLYSEDTSISAAINNMLEVIHSGYIAAQLNTKLEGIQDGTVILQ